MLGGRKITDTHRRNKVGVCGQVLSAEGHFITPAVPLGCRRCEGGTQECLLYTVVWAILSSVKFPNTVSQLRQETLSMEHAWFTAVPDLLVFYYVLFYSVLFYSVSILKTTTKP
jgi:hypothetical protein